MEALYIVIIVVCLFFSLFFSSADMAVTACPIDKLEEDVKNNKRGAKIALKLSKNYEQTISTILFGNNIANITSSSFVVTLGLLLDSTNGGLIGTAILTVFVIIFCEFLPKAITKRFAHSIWLFLAPITYFFHIIFFPLVWPLSKIFVFIGKPLEKKSFEEDEIDDDVLQEMVDTIEGEGLIEEGEADLLRSTIDLSETEAYEAMTARVDTYAIDVEDDVNELLNEPRLFDYSRVPVYEETIDNIIGILPVKALLKAILKGDKNISLRDLMYKPLFVPKNTDVLDLLAEFKESKIHIAVLIDEYGGTEGIITMEDILELIVGDIFDENDEIEEEVTVKDKDTFIIDGNMNIDDLFDLIDYKEDFDTNYSTAAGFCQEFFEDFCKVNDSFEFGGFKFTVLEADQFNAEKIELQRLKKEEEEDE